MLLAFPRIQRLLQEDWALVPHHVQHFASSQWYGEDAAAAAVANAAGPFGRGQGDRDQGRERREPAQLVWCARAAPAFAVLHNLALLACEAVAANGSEGRRSDHAAKEAAVQRRRAQPGAT